MSFRSTEFIDDAARDNQATNAMEIAPYGWAFGQIADMKKWVDSLYSSGKITADKPLTVTGYSLGGHLATAFNMLFPGDADATYTFNGAGVGRLASGASLTGVMAQFEQMRSTAADLSSQFTDSAVRNLYGNLRPVLQGGGLVTQTQIASARALTDPQRAGSNIAQAQMLVDALTRIQTIQTEMARVGTLSSGTANSAAPVRPPASSVEATNLNYQLAVLIASRQTEAIGPIVNGVQAVNGRQQGAYTIPNFYDLYGDTSPSAVSNSQLHYGQATPVFIEDQPLYRGSVIWDAITQSYVYSDTKLLVDGYANNDFGDTHSLVLMVDSLNVQNTLAALDPLVTQSTLGLILNGASNAKMQSGGGTNNQGKAEGDVLENTVDALRRIVQGPSTTKTPANMAGGTWADINARNLFDNNLKALSDSTAFKNIVGKVTVTSVVGDSSLPTKARTEFSALLTLLTLSPLALTAAAGYSSVVESALATGWSDVYIDWLADKSAVAAGAFAGNYTDVRLSDRQALLQWVEVRNLRNVADGVAIVAPGVLGDHFKDIDSKTDLYVNPIANVAGRQIIFGGIGTDALNGDWLEDRLYGGSGNDTLSGLGGADWLEGNAGADNLDGGEGEDTLLGGSGNDTLAGGGGASHDTLQGGAGTDTYVFDAGWGFDTVLDSDGSGTIQVTGLGVPVDGTNARKIADGSWQTLDKKITYTLVPVSDVRSDLFVSFSDRSDVIRIQDWSNEKKVGITLPDTVVAPVAPTTLTGDIAKQTNGNAYLLSPSGYASTGVQASAADVINGSAIGEALKGLGGNDGLSGGAGDDLLEGGEGDDLLLGGTGTDSLSGGAGNDFIFGSAMGRVSTPTAVDFTPPGIAANGVVAARGFSWVAGRAAGQRWNGDVVSLLGVAISGADAEPTFLGSDGLYHVENTGNVIDAGAGNDYVGAGAAADTVHGGDGDDDLYGMGGADVLFGDAGSDFIEGDGRATSGMGITTQTTEHGADTLVGGAGRDVLLGQGGNDELFGGTEDDQLWGDDPDLTDTPLSIHGNDYLDGGDGNDRLEGGGRDDELFGGAGSDTLWGDNSSTSTVTGAFEGSDYLDGGSGSDQLAGGGGDDKLFGGTGNDQLWGDAAYVSSGGGMVVSGANLTHAPSASLGQGKVFKLYESYGTPTLPAGSQPQGATLYGGSGDDVIYGGQDNDRLFGEDDNDLFVGNEGDDALDGGKGNDELSGGVTGNKLRHKADCIVVKHWMKSSVNDPLARSAA